MDAAATPPESAEAPDAYGPVHAASLADPEGFWLKAADALDWETAPSRAFDPEAGAYGRWFPDATLNACHNAVDRHVAKGRGEQAAILYDSPVTGTKRTISYAALRDEVATLAGILSLLGVEKGDRVVIYMPMIPEAVFGMLACARLGAVHSVVFGGFAANELAIRIADAAPKVVLAASCGIETEPGRALQAAAGRGHRGLAAQARGLSHPAASSGGGGIGGGTRPRLGRDGLPREGGRDQRRLRPRRGDRPALHPLYLGHDGQTQRRGAGYRRVLRGALLVDAQPLRCEARRGVFLRLRYRLGGGPFLHRLRAPAARLHHRPVRGQAGGHTRRGGALAGRGGIRRRLPVHRANGPSSYQEGRPARRARRLLRPVRLPLPVPRRRAGRPGFGRLGRAGPRPCR